MLRHSPWASLMLYALMVNLLILVVGNYASLTGNKKIYPRVFFSVFGIGLPFFLLASTGFIIYSEKLFIRVRWDMYQLIFNGLLSLLVLSLFVYQHIRLHGNNMGASPLEIPGDQGTTFVLVHGFSFFLAIALMRLVAGAILSYSLNGQPSTVVLSPY